MGYVVAVGNDGAAAVGVALKAVAHQVADRVNGRIEAVRALLADCASKPEELLLEVGVVADV